MKFFKPRAQGSAEDMLSRAVDAAGGLKEAAFRLSMSPGRLYDALDPDRPQKFWIDDLVRLAQTPEAAAVIADYFAALAGGRFEPGDEVRETPCALAVHFAARSGRVTAELMHALSDGQIDAREASAMLPAAKDSLAALSDLVSALALRAKG